MPVSRRSLRRGLLALAALLVAAPLRAQEAEPQIPRSDAVYLLDVSGSMRDHQALDRAKELLQGLLDKVVQPGTQVAFVPFGTGVHDVSRFDVPEDPEGARATLAEMRAAIGAVSARDSYTYLFEAVDQGLAVLREFKAKHPEHSRHLILVSDGKQLTPRDQPAVALRDVLERRNASGFKGPEDWFIWYAYLGEPDPHLKETLESTGTGQAIPLDRLASIRWTLTRLDTAALDLGRRMPGAWTETVRLVAETEAAGVGRRLRLQPAGDLPEGMAFDVTPREVELTAARTAFDVTLSVRGARGGAYEAALLLRAEEGALHWVEPRRVPVRFTVASPHLAVGAGRIDLGRVAPGQSATGRLRLLPDADARDARPQVGLRVARAEPGVTVTLAEDAFEAGEAREVAFTLQVPADAAEGPCEARLALTAPDGTTLETPEVTVAYRVGFGRVTVGTERLRFERVLTGETARAELTLSADAETAALGRRIGLILGGGLPAAVDVDLPGEVRLGGPVTVPVEVRVPAGVPGGTYRARLLFAAPGDVRVEPREIPLSLTVVEAASLLLPPVVDLGDVPASGARELRGGFDLAVAAHQAGAELELEADDGAAIAPRVFTLKKGTTPVALTLRTVDLGAGPHASRVRVFLTQDGARHEVGAIDFRWRVRETFLRVASWTPPPALPAGDAEIRGTLALDASGDLAGRRVRLAPAFPALAAGMRVTLAAEEVELAGGLQSVPVVFQVRGARTGHYPASLRVGLAAPVEGVAAPPPLDFGLDVAGATVYVAREGGFDGLQAGRERVVTLTLTAAAVPAPVTLDLELERGGLPDAVRIDLPEDVVLAKSDGVTRVTVRLMPGPDTPYGAWQPRLLVRARGAAVAVTPESVTIPADLPDPVTVIRERSGDPATALWAGIAAGVVILVGLAAFLLGRRRTEIVHVQVPAPAEEPALDEEDLIILE